jgi:hypothetical protein
MNTSTILGLVFHQVNCTNSEELQRCNDGLHAKYNERYHSIQLYAKDGWSIPPSLDGPHHTNSLIASQKWALNKTSSEGVGLYIITHGGEAGPNINNQPPTYGVIPASHQLTIIVDAIISLYKLGYRFRKINLSWCYSAGKANNKVTPMVCNDSSQTAGADFLKMLIQKIEQGVVNESIQPIIDNENKWVLDSTLVCGYAARVSYIGPAPQYPLPSIQPNCAQLTHAGRKFTTHNNTNTYTHPLVGNDKLLETLPSPTHTLQDEKSFTQHANQLKNPQNKDQQTQNCDDQRSLLLHTAIQYLIQTKIAWEVGKRHIIIRVPISKYTASALISDVNYFVSSHVPCARINLEGQSGEEQKPLNTTHKYGIPPQ